MKDRLELALLKKVFNIPLSLSELVLQDPALYSLDKLGTVEASSSALHSVPESLLDAVHVVKSAVSSSTAAKPPLHPAKKRHLVQIGGNIGSGGGGAVVAKRRRAFSSINPMAMTGRQNSIQINKRYSARPSRSMTTPLPISVCVAQQEQQPPVLQSNLSPFSTYPCLPFHDQHDSSSLVSPPLSAHGIFLPAMPALASPVMASLYVDGVENGHKQNSTSTTRLLLEKTRSATTSSSLSSCSLLPSPLMSTNSNEPSLMNVNARQQHYSLLHATWSDADWIRFFSI